MKLLICIQRVITHITSDFPLIEYGDYFTEYHYDDGDYIMERPFFNEGFNEFGVISITEFNECFQHPRISYSKVDGEVLLTPLNEAGKILLMNHPFTALEPWDSNELIFKCQKPQP